MRKTLLAPTVSRRRRAGLEAGDVVLMHDGGQDRSATVAAVPSIVAGTRQRGLQFGLLPYR